MPTGPGLSCHECCLRNRLWRTDVPDDVRPAERRRYVSAVARKLSAAPHADCSRHRRIVRLGQQVLHAVTGLHRRDEPRVGRGEPRLNHPVPQAVEPSHAMADLAVEGFALGRGEDAWGIEG